MKRIITSILMVAMTIVAMAQKPITIVNPEVGSKSVFTQGMFIEKIERTKNQTKIYFKYYHGSKENKIQISGESYLTANGKQFQQTGITGAPMNQFFEPTGENNTSEFALTFPPIDKNIQTVDYVECSGPTCFRIFDIPLTEQANASNKEQKAKAKEDFLNASKFISDGKSLEENKLMLGKSTVKGKFVGFRNNMFGDQELSVKCYFNNPISGQQEVFMAEVDNNGEFSIDINHVSKYQTIGIQTSPMAFINETFVASVGGTQEIFVDMNLLVDAINGKGNGYLYYKGDNANLNTAYAQAKNNNLQINYQDVIFNFKGKTANDFKNYIYDLSKEINSKIDNFSWPQSAKEYAKIVIRAQEGYYLGMGDYFMENAFRVQNSLDRDAPLVGYTKPEFNKEYLNYFKELDLNNQEMLYASEYLYAISNYSYLVQSILNQSGKTNAIILKQMMDSGNQDKLIENTYNILIAPQHNLSAKEMEDFNNFNEKYGLEFSKLFEQYTAKQKKELIDDNSGFFMDLTKAQSFLKILESRNLLDEKMIAEIDAIGNPIISQYAKQANENLRVEIEAEKAKGGYYVRTTSESTADAIMADILKNHKGKVVYIDLWATWCGPCRMGIAAMKPHHDSMEEKGVDFVYISDETSPLNEYNNTIVGMKGEHYRLTNQQMQTLKQKFKVSGIPFYIFVDKNGNVADTQSGFGGAERIVDKLTELINQ